MCTNHAKTLAEQYRRNRKPHYRHGFSYPTTALRAWSQAKMQMIGASDARLWDKLESLGYVRLRLVPDEGLSLDDVIGDCDSRNCLRNKGTCGKCHETSKYCRCREPRYCHLCQNTIDTVNRDGIWCALAEYRTTIPPHHDDFCGSECRCTNWQTADSLGNCCPDITDDYSLDLKTSAVDALRNALKNRLRIRLAVTAGLSRKSKAGAP